MNIVCFIAGVVFGLIVCLTYAYYKLKPQRLVAFESRSSVPGWIESSKPTVARCKDCKRDVARFRVNSDGSHVRCENCIRELGDKLG